MVSANAIIELHDQRTQDWHRPEAANAGVPDQHGDADSGSPWLQLVARQHRANFDLWHIEDEARAPGATDADLAQVKRGVDRTNQLRNDLAEELDNTLLRWLEPQRLPSPEAPLNSESPGRMLDRLSMLALKIYHTREEIERPGAQAGHAERNRERLAVLETQRNDLARCLDELWRETLAGTRRFKLYRQLKMYNDPSLNPAVYRKLTSSETDQAKS